MKQAAIYIRVSTDEQARHGYSLKEQEADLRRYAARKSYAIYDVYADEGTSARKGMSRRHELQRLLRDVEARRIDIILIKCLDRWFRNVSDFYEVQKVLNAHHVDLECSQEDYNTTTTDGRFMLNLMLSIAQNESDQTADRIKYIHDGLKRQKKETGGKYPLGYVLKDGRLAINEEERPIVEFIFASRLGGMSAHRIADAVFERFHFYITSQRVYLSLQNRTYIGERYGITDFCPVIIDAATFSQAQRSFRQKQRTARTKRTYLFSGKIVCPGCGHLLTMHHYKSSSCNPSGNSYYCNNKYFQPAACASDICKRSTVKESLVENFLLQNIQRLLSVYRVKHEAAHRAQASIQSKINYLQSQMKRLKILFIDGVIEHDEFQQKYKQLAQNLQVLEDSIRQQDEMPRRMKQILDAQDFASIYRTLSFDKRRELWQSLIERIEFAHVPSAHGIPCRDFKIIFYH